MTATVFHIDRNALHEQVVERLRTMIVEGHIAPGEKLNERELCELLGISRTPLREAIKLIAAEGMVELRPHRGAVVTKLSVEDLSHHFEMLAHLEGLAGQLAAERISAAELSEVRLLHHAMVEAYTQQDLPAYYRLNAAIHSLLNQAARNPVLTRSYQNLNTRLQALRFSSNHNRAKWQQAVQEHEQMLEALIARDGQRLRDILIAHVERKRDTVIAALTADATASQFDAA